MKNLFSIFSICYYYFMYLLKLNFGFVDVFSFVGKDYK